MKFLVIGYVLIAAQIVACYMDGTATRSQMRNRGVVRGLPFFSHGGMWGDIFFMTPLMWYLSGYLSEVTRTQQWIAASVALVATAGLHLLYAKGEDPGAHNRDGKLTIAGVLHAAYMWIAFLLLICFYFFATTVNEADATVVTVLLACFLPLGTLQPPYAVTGRIPVDAWAQCTGGWLLLIVGYNFLT